MYKFVLVIVILSERHPATAVIGLTCVECRQDQRRHVVFSIRCVFCSVTTRYMASVSNIPISIRMQLKDYSIFPAFSKHSMQGGADSDFMEFPSTRFPGLTPL